MRASRFRCFFALAAGLLMVSCNSSPSSPSSNPGVTASPVDPALIFRQTHDFANLMPSPDATSGVRESLSDIGTTAKLTAKISWPSGVQKVCFTLLDEELRTLDQQRAEGISPLTVDFNWSGHKGSLRFSNCAPTGSAPIPSGTVGVDAYR